MQELFNLRHAQARNAIERIFGVLKKRWAILTRAPQYPMDIQALIPCGLAAVHNFILENDSEDLDNYLEPFDVNEGPQGNGADWQQGERGEGAIPRVEKERATQFRNEIAMQMWESYQQFLHDHPEVLDQDFNVENE